MWYQFSQEQAHVLIEGLLCLRSALNNQKVRMPVFREQISRELSIIDELYNKLYDEGQLNMPIEPGAELKW